MSTTITTAGQCLLDVCLQELGGVAALFDLADANGLAVTDALTPGQQVTVPASASGRADVAGLFAARAYRVNTGDVPSPAPTAPVGHYFSFQFFSSDTFA